MPIDLTPFEKLIAIITLIVSFIAAVVGGTFVAILNRLFEKQKQTDEQDIKIFNQSNEILNEQKIIGVIDFHLLNGYSILEEDFSLIRKWLVFFQAVSHMYLNKSVNVKKQKLFENLSRLEKFIAENFDTKISQNSNNSTLYLQPNLDPDRTWNPDGVINPVQVAKFQEFAEKLEVLSKNVKEQYLEYRLAIKQKLKI